MSFHADDRGRIGQSSYWLHFGGYILVAVLLVVIGVYQIFSRQYLVGFMAILAVAPLGIYFRVIMMRRCRDIGWPVILPWLMMILSAVGGFWGGLHGVINHRPSIAGPMTFGALSGIVDFVLTIVLGCIPSKNDGNFDDYNFDPRVLPQAPLPYDPEASFRSAAQPLPVAAPIQPRTPTGPRHSGGFGRRGL